MGFRPEDLDGNLNPVTRSVLRLRWGIRNLPADLAAVVVVVLVTNVAALAPLIRDTPLRVVFGLAFVLFVPGYAFIAALFPEQNAAAQILDEERTDDSTGPAENGAIEEQRDGIDGLERVALSFGLSIAITPLIGLVLNFTPWGIRLVPILLSLSGFALLAVVVAAHRRWALPATERFQVPYREWAAAGRSELFKPATRTDAILNVVLVLSVLLAASSVGYAVLVPQEGEQFSELYLLSETDDGELTADNYPTEFTVGEGHPLVVGIGNHEHEQTEYTVVSQLQRVEVSNNSTSTLRSERLATFNTTLGHNETWHHQHTVTPTYEGTDLRLLYLLYRGEPPENPTIENAYRENHLWVNVTS